MSTKEAKLRLSYCENVAQIMAIRMTRAMKLYGTSSGSEEGVEDARLNLLKATLDEDLAKLDLENAEP